MIRTRFALALVFALALSAAGGARAAPAWWRVSNGRSEVWILGSLTPTPRDFDWDRRDVERRVRAARMLIVPPEPRGGPGAALEVIRNAKAGSLAGLTPSMRTEFDGLARAVGKSSSDYDRLRPAVAGGVLASDYLKAQGLRSGEVLASVRDIARRSGVPVSAAGSIDTAEMVRIAEALPPAAQAACLEASLQALETEAPSARGRAAAWARGEPPAPGANRSSACLSAAPALKVLDETALNAQVAAVGDALRAGGSSVAAFDVRRLTEANGLLDRLRARGYAVEGPIR